MCCSCAMMSSSVTSPIAKEGVDVDGAERDGAEREGGSTESDRNCAMTLPRPKLRLTTSYGSGVYGTYESEMVG